MVRYSILVNEVSSLLSQNQFSVLFALQKTHEGLTQREIAENAGLALGTVNAVVRECAALGYIVDRQLSSKGLEALQPYRVENAVIMAAGFSSRFAPLSYEAPKGTMRVKGEVLIERQIRQLQDAGISEITVVVGYMKESFFYLEDAFGVEIAVNEEYTSRNNNSTLMLIAGSLANTYICSSDNYFKDNPFEPYVYGAYYAAEYVSGTTDEYCISTDGAGRIISVTEGGHDSLIMIGHAYFSRDFSERFRNILTEVYQRPETADKLWEDVFVDNLDSLSMVVRPYPEGSILEFDSLEDLAIFDHDFVENVDSQILDNICDTLDCTRAEISAIEPIKSGLTNLSFKFAVSGNESPGVYVYRHPGLGTDEIINRESETYSQVVARELGIDATFVFEDPKAGWKISRFVEDCVPFDNHDWLQVEKALEMVRTLHDSSHSSEWTFDVYQKATEIVGLLGARSYPMFPDFDHLRDGAARLARLTAEDGVVATLCHNDFYAPNILVSPEGMDLIDWEYSAMSDYASDLGTFICCTEYSLEEARKVIDLYFGGSANEGQLRHCLAYVSISAYYWFVWALYKEATGDAVGKWIYLWYRAAKSYGRAAEEAYAAAARD